MEHEKKYLEYKKMVDYHVGKCQYYEKRSKTMYMKHYRYYKYYYIKMEYYAKKCAPMKDNYEYTGHNPECDTHTHYKHYYHHHHIVKHHQHCDEKKCEACYSTEGNRLKPVFLFLFLWISCIHDSSPHKTFTKKLHFLQKSGVYFFHLLYSLRRKKGGEVFV